MVDLFGEERIADRGHCDPTGCTATSRHAAVIALIREFPGSTGADLADSGLWSYREHGSLRDAEEAGVIWWDGWGWNAS